MQSSTSLQLPASDPPSPSSDGGAKSSRVCLNCRRKKKKCDKKLPSCGRCTYSLEFCQHEDDHTVSRPVETSSHTIFETLGSGNSPGAYPVSPFLGTQLGPTSPTIGPALFAPLEATEDVHHFVSRSIAQIMGDQVTTESIVRYYFGTINTWFTIIEKEGFEERLARMWAEPSAETGLLALCMLMIVRSPDETANCSMQNSLYYSIKTLCGIVVAKVPLSTSILQANLLICLYELVHFIPQQAYLTLGTCTTIVRAFGWLEESFWGQDQWISRARELKLCSILWWSMSFLENGIQTEELGYPCCIPSLDFSIPFPETFDPILQLAQGGQYGGTIQEETFRFADDGDDKINTIVFPEAKSTSLLTQVLQQTAGRSSIPMLSRDGLTSAIVDHARTIVSTPWKDGSRFAALSLTYTAILKLNYPHLGIGRGTRLSYDPSDRSAIQNTIPAIESICHSAQLITSSSSLSFLGPLVPTLAYSMFLAAKLLIVIGGALMQGPEWSSKVQLLRSCLEVFAKRWRIADRYVQALNATFQAHLNQLNSR